MMTLQAPQLTYLAIVCISLGIAMAQHGKTKTETKNFFTVLIGTAIQMGIMYWGGFFS